MRFPIIVTCLLSLSCQASSATKHCLEKIDWNYTQNGVGYHINKKGRGAKISLGAILTVHYIGYLEDGTEFDNSLKRKQPFTFTLGDGITIKGWDDGIKEFKNHSKGFIKIPPKMAYGEEGAGNIPENSTLIYYIKIIEVSKAGVSMNTKDLPKGLKDL